MFAVHGQKDVRRSKRKIIKDIEHRGIHHVVFHLLLVITLHSPST